MSYMNQDRAATAWSAIRIGTAINVGDTCRVASGDWRDGVIGRKRRRGDDRQARRKGEKSEKRSHVCISPIGTILDVLAGTSKLGLGQPGIVQQTDKVLAA